MKVKPHLVSVFVRCRYGLDEGTVFFETDYEIGGFPLISTMFKYILFIWNEVVPVGEEKRRDGDKISIHKDREWRLSINNIGAGGVSFSIRVPKEECRQFETYFSEDQCIYLEIVPGGWNMTLSQEEYVSKKKAQKKARHKRIKRDHKDREKERAKSEDPVADSDKSDKTVEVIHIG